MGNVEPRRRGRDKLEKYIIERIKFYNETKRSFEAAKRSFDDEKFEFKSEMDKYFDSLADEDGKIVVQMRDETMSFSKLICQRISQVSVEFHIPKLKKILTKKQQKSVIRKHYQVNNWPGLLNLLKESGVEWEEFLKYVNITESVDTAALEKLVELGDVDKELVIDCSNSKIKTEYYKVTEK